MTLTLADSPVSEVVAAAQAQGLSALETSALALFQRLRIGGAQALLVQMLAQPPYEATLIGQEYSTRNTITIQIKADRVSMIQELPGILAVRVGPDTVPPVLETPSRGESLPGTRVSPPKPPGFNH